jgi:integrase
MTNFRRFHSVRTPLAASQTSLLKELQPQLANLAECSIVRLAHDMISRLSGPAKDVAKAQLYSGSRAVEILSLTVDDIDGGGFVCIHARKGSTTRAQFLPHLLPYKETAVSVGRRSLFEGFTYSKYRRQLLSAAGGYLPSTCSRDVISNLFRRASAEIASRLSGGDVRAAAHSLGHRSITSTNYYLTKESKHRG